MQYIQCRHCDGGRTEDKALGLWKQTDVSVSQKREHFYFLFLKLMRCEPISRDMKESVGTVVVVFLFVPACIPMHSGPCSPVVLPGSVDK